MFWQLKLCLLVLSRVCFGAQNAFLPHAEPIGCGKSLLQCNIGLCAGSQLYKGTVHNDAALVQSKDYVIC